MLMKLKKFMNWISSLCCFDLIEVLKNFFVILYFLMLIVFFFLGLFFCGDMPVSGLFVPSGLFF